MNAKKGFFQSAWSIFKPVTSVQVTNAPAAPAAAQQQPADKKEADPLDQLGALWKNDPTKTAVVDPLAGPVLNTDPAKIVAASKQIDMLAGVDADTLAKARSGDGEAIVALIQAATQASVATGAQISANATEEGLRRQTQRIVQALPGQLKQHAIATAPSEHAILQHEAAAPFVQMTRKQVAASNPNLSPAEVNAQADAILMGFGKAISGNTEDAGYREGGVAPRAQQGAGTDWGKWAGID